MYATAVARTPKNLLKSLVLLPIGALAIGLVTVSQGCRPDGTFTESSTYSWSLEDNVVSEERETGEHFHDWVVEHTGDTMKQQRTEDGKVRSWRRP